MKVEQYVDVHILITDYATEAVECANKFAEEHLPTRYVARAIGSLLALSTLAIAFSPVKESHRMILERAVPACALDDSCEEIFLPGDLRIPEALPTTTVQPATTAVPPEVITPTSTPAVVAKSPPTTIKVLAMQRNQPEATLAPEQQRAIATIETMQLSREAYVNALSSINTEFYDYAQSKPKFTSAEMERQGISQGKTVFTTKHVSAAYYNADGSVTDQPVGDTSNPQLFIDKIISMNDPRCCAVNQFVDRNAVIYWLAPRSAKLRHNLGYDGQTTGKEIEGYLNQDLTKEQLEASAYLDIGNLYVEGLHTKTLEETIRGHAKTRQQYNDAHPENRQPVKIDWQEEPTAAYRRKLAEFLQANPDLAELTPRSFLALP